MHSTRARTPKTRTGFTLIEVMVVILIIAIITTFAVVKYSGFRRHRQLVLSKTQVISYLQRLRTNAITMPTVYGIKQQGQQLVAVRLMVNPKTQQAIWLPPRSKQLIQPLVLPNDIQLMIDTPRQSKKKQAHNKNATPQPVLIIQSTGEITPYTITLTTKASGAQLTVTNADA